jgi:hypothetical protein
MERTLDVRAMGRCCRRKKGRQPNSANSLARAAANLSRSPGKYGRMVRARLEGGVWEGDVVEVEEAWISFGGLDRGGGVEYNVWLILLLLLVRGDITRVLVVTLILLYCCGTGWGVLGAAAAVSLPTCHGLRSLVTWCCTYDSNFAASVGDNVRLCVLARRQFDQQPFRR